MNSCTSADSVVFLDCFWSQVCTAKFMLYLIFGDFKDDFPSVYYITHKHKKSRARGILQLACGEGLVDVADEAVLVGDVFEFFGDSMLARGLGDDTRGSAREVAERSEDTGDGE